MEAYTVLWKSTCNKKLVWIQYSQIQSELSLLYSESFTVSKKAQLKTNCAKAYEETIEWWYIKDF